MRLDLVRQAQRGDREAFDVVMLEQIDRLYAIARLVAQDADVAEDAVQEALIRCWRDLPSLRDVNRFEAWLRRLLLNSVAEEFRRRRRFQANVRVLHAEPTVSDGSAARADRDALHNAFGRLSIEHRTIVVLHHYLGMSTDEVATNLDIPSGTAKSRLHYAMDALRAVLESDDRRSETRRLRA